MNLSLITCYQASFHIFQWHVISFSVTRLLPPLLLFLPDCWPLPSRFWKHLHVRAMAALVLDINCVCVFSVSHLPFMIPAWKQLFRILRFILPPKNFIQFCSFCIHFVDDFCVVQDVSTVYFSLNWPVPGRERHKNSLCCCCVSQNKSQRWKDSRRGVWNLSWWQQLRSVKVFRGSDPG